LKSGFSTDERRWTQIKAKGERRKEKRKEQDEQDRIADTVLDFVLSALMLCGSSRSVFSTDERRWTQRKARGKRQGKQQTGPNRRKEHLEPFAGCEFECGFWMFIRVHLRSSVDTFAFDDLNGSEPTKFTGTY
jgi:hypothetical protein